ncbi:MAG: CPBP family intramembrane glutamic endopeptidase [Anaerolineales bacterium]
MNEKIQPANKFIRFLQFPFIRVVLGFVFLLLVVSLAQFATVAWPGHDTNFTNLVSVVITVVVVGFAYYGFVRVIERRNVTELSSHTMFVELASGALVGAILFSVTIGVLWLMGYYKVIGTNPWTVMFSWFVLAIISGVSEELLFRGILFRVVEESLGTWLSLAISALIFGLFHLANPNATLWGAIAIAIEAGIMLAAAFVYSRRLWLPIGIHFAWNFMQGAVFGVAVSGNEAKGLLQSTLSGPSLLSGGAFGAEGSIFAVVVCLIAGIYLIWKSHKDGKFVPPFWKR